MNKDYTEFVRLVFRMRKQQKEYFKTRQQSDLKASKALEKEVDDRIKKISAEYFDSLQINMFDGLTEFIQMGGVKVGK